MIDYDLHIHTNFVKHADRRQTIPAILAHAAERGLRFIAITEHVSGPADLGRIEQIREEVASVPNPCRVFVGAEIDADRNFTDGRLVVDKRPDLDLVIGSLHFLPGTDVLPHCEPMPQVAPEQVFERWRDTFLGLTANPIIDILAHPGALIGNALDKTCWVPEVLEVFGQGACLSARNGIAWEVNNLIAVKLSATQRQQYWRIIKIACDAGVTLTYGSDAHKPEDVGNVDFVGGLLAKLPGVKLDENVHLRSGSLNATL